MSSYQKVKNYIFYQLQNIDKENGKLNDNSIDEQIKNVKKVISSGVNKYIPSLGSNIFLQDQDWKRIYKELDSQFNALWDASVLIQGDSQQKRDDPKWWTDKIQQETESYYWNKYKEYLCSFLSSDAIHTIDGDTSVVMNNIENPSIKQFDRRGMVVGHVQSGKTGNYAGLICKAADAGYKFIIVISGTNINNLRNQTQKRLDEAFIGIHKGNKVGSGYSQNQGSKQPISLTSAERDFRKEDAVRNAGVLNLDNTTAPIFLVIKKNVTALKNVIDWLNSLSSKTITKHAMLMIDDEADYASINYNDDENPSRINERLRNLLTLFNRSSYVGYTATPYANVFINHKAGNEKSGDDLFPRDFIYALGSPDNYFGARAIFLDEDKRYLVPIDDYQDDIPKHKKDFELPSIPDSLYEAMRVFLLNIAIRHLRGHDKEHNSMLVHATLFTAVHQKLASHVTQYIEKIRNDIMAYGKLPNARQKSHSIQSLQDTLNLRYAGIEFYWDDILNSLCHTINTIIIREVHAQTKIKLNYRDDTVTNAIVIGGASLSRGYTLEGLSVSYFLRNTIFYDTLMQMGRWFGYRYGYQDLCKIYMTNSMIDNFGHIIKATEDLIESFREMEDLNMTPNDFGLAVKQHPDSKLQVTARNKLSTAGDWYFEMKLDGHLKDTGWLYTDKETNLKNLYAIKNIVSNICKNNKKLENINGKYLWRDVDKNHVHDFILNFIIPKSSPLAIHERMPIDFVKEYAEKINTKWDVVVYGKNDVANFNVTDSIFIAKEERKSGVNIKGNQYEIRQISTGVAESIIFSKEERNSLGSNRKNIRKAMKKPLLMLHILDTQHNNKLAAFSISFPGGITSRGTTVKAKINTVRIQEILKEEQADDY